MVGAGAVVAVVDVVVIAHGTVVERHAGLVVATVVIGAVFVVSTTVVAVVVVVARRVVGVVGSWSPTVAVSGVDRIVVFVQHQASAGMAIAAATRTLMAPAASASHVTAPPEEVVRQGHDDELVLVVLFHDPSVHATGSSARSVR